MSFRIVCADPNHDSRKNQPDWSETLGLLGAGESVGAVTSDGMLCGACGEAANERRIAAMPDLDALRSDVEGSTTLAGLRHAVVAVLDALGD